MFKITFIYPFCSRDAIVLQARTSLYAEAGEEMVQMNHMWNYWFFFSYLPNGFSLLATQHNTTQPSVSFDGTKEALIAIQMSSSTWWTAGASFYQFNNTVQCLFYCIQSNLQNLLDASHRKCCSIRLSYHRCIEKFFGCDDVFQNEIIFPFCIVCPMIAQID